VLWRGDGLGVTLLRELKAIALPRRVAAEFYLDWDLVDPAGKPLATVRRIRDEIDGRVEGLLAELTRSLGQ
jgi:hypothetical protein